MAIPEEWLSVVGWEGYYEVSSHGRVRSLARDVHVASSWYKSSYIRRMKGRVLRPSFDENGYPFVNLQTSSAPGGPIRRGLRVHRLVTEAFLGPCPVGREVAHNDGNQGNPKLDNLRYATPTENNGDKTMHGTQLMGEANPAAKLTLKQVAAIRVSRERHARLAEQYGCSRSNIGRIKRGNTWQAYRVSSPSRTSAPAR